MSSFLESIVSVEMSDSLAKALRLMIRHSVSHIPIVYGDEYAGVVSKTTITEHLASCLLTSPDMTIGEAFEKIGVGKFVGGSLLSVEIDDFFNQALQMLIGERVGSILVFRENDCLGIITKTDILCALNDYIELSLEAPVGPFIESWLKNHGKVRV